MNFLITIFVVAVCAALGVMVVLAKILGFRRMLGLHAAVDVVASLILGWTFFGTLTGMSIGIAAGLIVSVLLWFGRARFGYERPRFSFRHGLVWTVVSPTKTWR